MTPKKIISIQLNQIEYSGAEIIYFNLLQYLKNDFDEIHFLVTGNTLGNFAAEFNSSKVRIFHFRIDRIRALFQYIAYLTKYKPEIVHINREDYYFYFSLLTYLFSKSKIIRSYHSFYKYGGTRLGKHFYGIWRTKKMLERLICRKLFNVRGLSVSPAVKENEDKCFKNKTVLLENSIDSSRFKAFPMEYRNDLKRKLGLSKEVFYFIIVGSCLHIKRHSVVIQALAKMVAKSFGKIELIHLGNGNLFSKEEELANELKIFDKISFLQKVNNVNEFLLSSDCYIMPSENEGQGLALIEALGCGTPVILSDIQAFQWLKNQDSVQFFKLDDIEDLVEKMNVTYCNISELKKSATTFSKKICNDYSIEKYYSKLKETYFL